MQQKQAKVMEGGSGGRALRKQKQKQQAKDKRAGAEQKSVIDVEVPDGDANYKFHLDE